MNFFSNEDIADSIDEILTFISSIVVVVFCIISSVDNEEPMTRFFNDIWLKLDIYFIVLILTKNT